MELAENIYESYGTHLRDLKVVGHPILINNFEDFIEICVDCQNLRFTQVLL